MDPNKTYMEQYGAKLNSNKAINTISGLPEMAFRMLDKQSFSSALEDTFTELDLDKDGNRQYLTKDGKRTTVNPGGDAKALRKTRWGRVAGSLWAGYTGAKIVGGAVGGALTDSNGRLDIPGIPLI